MESEAARLKTFTEWPHAATPNCKCTPKAMAEAGFYLAPVPPKAIDRVICHSCGIELVDWIPSDIPSVEHLRFSPDCKFMNQQMDSSDPAKSLFVQQLILSSVSEPIACLVEQNLPEVQSGSYAPSSRSDDATLLW
ncbi:baculoviral IAP repeat-containing protein [Monocercomonoides exilis]|uniref:baculoviral IAP repeat-containing protein n=1 Tax=Monocercomonoides exilis TaxID=2049356 RepID=UPI00355AC230|nr:baculoviral IAP repeat-containing protein [Monocercomonoides exilis]|eukprot:MONOS_10839.1-p1 / transcript=MONOS_10839.1 / gene=MONOS_10839 / organism=Monocercomonoides_exilis_PA203 / gene_product=baculoviral IAP repeat-containing protein / transcript_product=baculoviral IAP repeat-containing protein / location=Mono_scaffold00509:43291-43841(-) / protein_length=136 / sequence_SO=supercontig / SO=protein_coding / is_pseudo=false